MKKIINQPMAFVDEMLEGLLLAHGRPQGAPPTRGRSSVPMPPVRAR